MVLTPESVLKKSLKRILTDRGAYWVMVAGGVYAKPGDPDIVACYHGCFIAIEAKTYKGVQSDWQKLREKQVKDAQGIYVVIRSTDALIQLLDDLDKISDTIE